MFKPLKTPAAKLYTVLLVTAAAAPFVLTSPYNAAAKPATSAVADKTDEAAQDAKLAAARAALKAKIAQRAARRAELLENPPIALDKMKSLAVALQNSKAESAEMKEKALELRKGMAALYLAEEFDKAQFVRMSNEIASLNFKMQSAAVRDIAEVLATFTVEERRNLLKLRKNDGFKKAMRAIAKSGVPTTTR